jgi:peptidoglycan glycosyltransferase
MSVAGKTGTAQHGEGTRPHAWFISFAPADDSQIAVAVVVESGLDDPSDISGGRLAAPIAKSVMEAYLR